MASSNILQDFIVADCIHFNHLLHSAQWFNTYKVLFEGHGAKTAVEEK